MLLFRQAGYSLTGSLLNFLKWKLYLLNLSVQEACAWSTLLFCKDTVPCGPEQWDLTDLTLASASFVRQWKSNPGFSACVSQSYCCESTKESIGIDLHFISQGSVTLHGPLGVTVTESWLDGAGLHTLIYYRLGFSFSDSLVRVCRRWLTLLEPECFPTSLPVRIARGSVSSWLAPVLLSSYIKLQHLYPTRVRIRSTW